MLTSIFNLFICYLFIFIRNISGTPPCVYDLGNGEILDIRPLGNKKTPKYDNIPNITPIRHSFSWNACFDYSKSDGGNCINAAVCSTDLSSGQSTLMAKQSEAVMEHNDAVNLLYYKHENILVNVYLICNPDGPETVTGQQDSSDIININVRSPCCCPGRCHYSEDSSVSGGGIFLILLVVLAVVYILGGMIFLRVSHGATGFEMIPNRLLWLNILSYAIDGIRYSILVIRHRSLSVEYQKV